ncbi:enoyl-CoA hydratase/isomerase family protein [Microbacterium sp. G2-8]|uniref:enoyl-CoA hydratase/isomerase family protein n=1 Tax=Microbacterium sp. G2-8 TaxID=2842454 RepID=UPI0027E38882|nr:enoyl-CoA hydratase/isomerase family protein [Microbacterium sp. G2-8]
MTANDAERILTRKQNGVGRITLDRPEALNALDLGMAQAIMRALDGWREDPDVQVVLLDGAGYRGFCAGGDVRALHRALASGDFTPGDEFLRHEYRTDLAIAEYATPIVSIADGVTMGGGIGLASHAHVRIVTETASLAMPETRIGFTPDAGGSWLLAHAPGRIGEYLALTSDTMGPADAIYAGFADHFVRRADVGAVRHALETRADPATATELVMLFDETPEEGDLRAAREWIDEAFAIDTAEGVVDRLRSLAEDPRWSGRRISPATALAALEERPPTALAVTLAAIRSSRALRGLREAIDQEHRLVTWFAETQPDMLEGIRAQMIDKDRAPRWNPATFADLSDDIVGDAFSYEPARPLFD